MEMTVRQEERCLEIALIGELDHHAARSNHGARLFSRIAYVLHGLDELPLLRAQVASRRWSALQATTAYIKLVADPGSKLPEITYWLMGSFTSASYQKILIGCPLILVGIAVIYLLRWR